MIADESLEELPSDECHWTLQMMSQGWFRWWLGAIKHKAITWTTVDSYLRQGLPFLKIITCPTSRILKFSDLLIWNKEEKSVQIHLPDW